MPYVGAKVNTYLAGTTTPVATYTDSGLTVANANPIITDAAGRYVAYLSPGASYKFVVTDANGVAIKTVDNITAVPASSANLDITGTAGEALTAGQAVYLSDGSGAKAAGQWFKADAANTYSSTSPEVGMVPASITSGSSGSIRLSGLMTGLTSLTIGTTYYIGTAGAITSSAPANARVLGVADTTSTLVLAGDPAKYGPGSAGSLTAHGVVLGQGAAVVTATAAGTTGQFLIATTGADPAFTAGAVFGASTVLLKANTGTDTSAGATNVDTIALTGLTAKDTLLVFYSAISVTQATADLSLYSSTDSQLLAGAMCGSIAAAELVSFDCKVMQSQASGTSYWTFKVGGGSAAGAKGPIPAISPAMTTAFTGNWTLALRHGGVTAGGTLQWRWSVYKVSGQ